MKSSFKTYIRWIERLAAAAGIVCAACWMVSLSKFSAAAPLPTAARDQQRLKARADIHEISSAVLRTYGPQYPEKGFIWVPIDRAMDLIVTEWKDPAAGRSNLLLRAAIALEIPPPPGAATNQYE